MGLVKFLSVTSLFMLPAQQAFAWDATPYNPPAVPLAVRTPYLSAWLPQGAGAALNDRWPTFWTGSTLGWAGFLKVDGKAYSFLGDPKSTVAFTKATQKRFEVRHETRNILLLLMIGGLVYSHPEYVRPFCRTGRFDSKVPEPC